MLGHKVCVFSIHAWEEIMTYAKQYSISSLTGVYAQKYSVTIDDAARLDALLLLANASPSLAGFAARGEEARYDGYEAFNALMKVLKYVMKDPRRTFCTKIVAVTPDGEREGISFSDSDDMGDFEVRAYGRTGMVVRGGEACPFEEMTGRGGTYRAVLEPMSRVFKDDLMNLLNICEETMAKNADIVAKEVCSDAPKAAPLFQL